jgi:hypothetical protein
MRSRVARATATKMVIPLALRATLEDDFSVTDLNMGDLREDAPASRRAVDGNRDRGPGGSRLRLGH